MTGSPRRTRLAPLYSNLKLLQFRKIYMYPVQLLMYKRHQGFPTEYISVIFLYKFWGFWAKSDNLIYYVCLTENLVLEEELSPQLFG